VLIGGDNNRSKVSIGTCVCLRVVISQFPVAIARKFEFVVAGELESLLGARVCSCWKGF